MKRKILLLALIGIALIIFAGCGKSDTLQNGGVSVTLSSNGEKLQITVRPDAELLEKYSDSQLILFMNDPGESFGDGSNAVELGRKRAKESLSFSVPLIESGRSKLYCSFTAAFFDNATNRYVEAATAAYVSNPEKLAENTSDYPKNDSIKGIKALYDTEAVTLGVSHVIIDLPIEKYLLDTGNGSAYSYIFNGKSYFVDSDAVDELDGRVRYYTDNGVTVYLRFTLISAASQLPEKLSCLAAPSSSEGESRYIINMANPECAKYVAGFADFIAERYTREDGKYGLISAFIASSDANTPGKSAGTLTKDTYIYSNECLVRILYLSLVSHYSNGRVFVSVDNNLKYAASDSCDMNVYDFVTDFAKRTKAAGDYPWGVCARAQATSADPDRVWYDNSGDGAYITPSNLAGLTDELMGKTELMYDGNVRSIIIGDFSVSVTDTDKTQSNQAASYAYAYYQAVATNKIEAFVYSSPCDEGVKKDGLRALDENGNPSLARQIYSVFADIDTDADINAVVGAIVTDSAWQTLYNHYRENVVKKNKYTGGAILADPAGYELSTLFDFSSGTTEDFSVWGCESFIGLVPMGDSSALSAQLSKPAVSDSPYIARGGLEKKDLRGNNVLVTLCAEGISAEVGTYYVRLCLVQENKKGNDVIYISDKTAISGGGTVTVAFDTKSVAKSFGKGEIELRIYAESENGMGCILRVDEIMTGKKKTNTVLLVVLVVLAVAALIAAVTLLGIWFKNNYKISIETGETKEERAERRRLKKEQKVQAKAQKTALKNKKSESKSVKSEKNGIKRKKTQKKT